MNKKVINEMTKNIISELEERFFKKEVVECLKKIEKM